ncbi:hypothetical protein [Thermomonospora cellulosilytica]|uniref:Uncharacterized protein n=1 Tax=Thermomonospora cellulosilytica TaxID=1411118 RepID=A0A7W3RBS5_9ACTN|nr:hypothetical protein [Thermomonospora cellulosilytica]MBA9007201.1 hypothetical protein [Thermomonospora cellulosilytica]
METGPKTEFRATMPDIRYRLTVRTGCPTLVGVNTSGSPGRQGRQGAPDPRRSRRDTILGFTDHQVIGGLLVAIIVGVAGFAWAKIDPDVQKDKSGPGANTPSPIVDSPPTPDPRSEARVRWRGFVELPLAANVPSDVGLDLDGESPTLVGAQDDLRGDNQTAPKVIVFTGRVAEVSGDVGGLSREECERSLPPGASREPVFLPVYRGNGVNGTYCFTTTENKVAAFAMVSADFPLPTSVRIEAVVWE